MDIIIEPMELQTKEESIDKEMCMTQFALCISIGSDWWAPEE